jgi:hypothetical protein
MNESSGFVLRRAWRLVGVFAPVTIVALVPVALVAVTGTLWTQWLALAVTVVLVAGAGWTLMRGEPLFVRAGARSSHCCSSTGGGRSGSLATPASTRPRSSGM